MAHMGNMGAWERIISAPVARRSFSGEAGDLIRGFKGIPGSFSDEASGYKGFFLTRLRIEFA